MPPLAPAPSQTPAIAPRPNWSRRSPHWRWAIWRPAGSGTRAGTGAARRGKCITTSPCPAIQAHWPARPPDACSSAPNRGSAMKFYLPPLFRKLRNTLRISASAWNRAWFRCSNAASPEPRSSPIAPGRSTAKRSEPLMLAIGKLSTAGR